MTGTKAGAVIAVQTTKGKYGEDFYRIAGAKGGKKGRTGGFYYLKVNGQEDKIRACGQMGGKKSKRRKDSDVHQAS